MALLKKCELHYIRLVPDRPNKKYNRENPTWEVQIRTTEIAQKKEWEAQGVRLKAVVPEDGSPPYWKTTLKKKIFKKDGTPNDPVTIKAGNLTTKIDPATIGNGSIGNVRVFQYDYKGEKSSGTANVLMEVQLTKLKKFTPKPRDDDFEEEDMEIIEEDESEEEDDESQESESSDEEEELEEEEEPAAPTPPKKTPSIKKPKFD